MVPYRNGTHQVPERSCLPSPHLTLLKGSHFQHEPCAILELHNNMLHARLSHSPHIQYAFQPPCMLPYDHLFFLAHQRTSPLKSPHPIDSGRTTPQTSSRGSTACRTAPLGSDVEMAAISHDGCWSRRAVRLIYLPQFTYRLVLFRVV